MSDQREDKANPVRPDGTVDLKALRMQDGIPGTEQKPQNAEKGVESKKSVNVSPMSVEETTTDNVSAVGESASAPNGLSPEVFKAMCDVVWPVDKNIHNIFDVWHAQGFQIPQVSELTHYPSLPGTRNIRACGFIQWKNGPCGVLAAVQGWVIRYYLFEKAAQNGQDQMNLSDRKDPTTTVTGADANAPYSPAVRAIYMALVQVLIRSSTASEGKQTGKLAVLNYEENQLEGKKPLQNFLVAHLGTLSAISGRYPGYREHLRVLDWKSKAELKELVGKHLDSFMAPGGLVMLLYSLVLTRGIERIQSELWISHTPTLVANGNGYCNQELVNLLIAGQATAGIHDIGNKDVTAVYGKGIPSGQEIGFFPPKPSAQLLGSHLKSPIFPIWIVLAKSHYSIVFLSSTDGYIPSSTDVFGANKKSHMILYHYNGLESLRWREPESIEPTARGTLKSFKGPRLAFNVLREKAWAHIEKEMAEAATSSSSLGLGQQIQEERWQCGACTFNNPANANKCQVCTLAKPSKDGGPLPYCVFASRLVNKSETKSGGDSTSGSGTLSSQTKSSDLSKKIEQLNLVYQFQVQSLDGKKKEPEKEKPTQPWTCSTCTFSNPPARTLCQMCMTPKPGPPKPIDWQCSACTFRNPVTATSCSVCSTPNPKAGVGENQPYQCVSCSVVNDPKLHPKKCGVCGKVRQRLELCEWKDYDQLPGSMHAEVYKFLPDLLTTMHILWPKTTLIYVGSQPSMTT